MVAELLTSLRKPEIEPFQGVGRIAALEFFPVRNTLPSGGLVL